MVPPSGARRLLFFAYYFPPLGGAGSQRALSFVKYLPPLGFDVVVIAPREGVFGTDESVSVDGLAGVRVVRTGTFEPSVLLRRVLPRKAGVSSAGVFVDEAEVGSIGSALRDWARSRFYFPDSCRGWISHALRAAGREHARGPFHAVLSSSPPVSAHVAAHRFSTKHGLPWLADWRDPWTEHIPAAYPRLAEARELELNLLAGASASITASIGITKLVTVKDSEAQVTTVQNGFDPDQFGDVGRRQNADGVFRITYAGTLYPPGEQYPGGFFEAVARIRRRRPEARLRIRFLGKADARASELARASGVLDIVDFVGFQDHARCVEAMLGSNLLLMIAYNREDMSFKVEIPAKTYEYLAARRPILALADPSGEAADLLQGRNCVWVKSARDVDGIEVALLEAMAIRDPVLPPWADILEFSRATQAEKLAGVLRRLVEEPRR